MCTLRPNAPFRCQLWSLVVLVSQILNVVLSHEGTAYEISSLCHVSPVGKPVCAPQREIMLTLTTFPWVWLHLPRFLAMPSCRDSTFQNPFYTVSDFLLASSLSLLALSQTACASSQSVCAFSDNFHVTAVFTASTRWVSLLSCA